MRKVNTNDLDELAWSSPKGRYAGFGKQVSEALGRVPDSHDLDERHPFDVEISRVVPGGTPHVYHAHSAQWEFYHVISGTGAVRDETGLTEIGPGDAFIFKPGELHQIQNPGTTDLVMYVVADNPLGEFHYYPDGNKYGVGLPMRRYVRSEPGLHYFDDEE